MRWRFIGCMAIVVAMGAAVAAPKDRLRPEPSSSAGQTAHASPGRSSNGNQSRLKASLSNSGETRTICEPVEIAADFPARHAITEAGIVVGCRIGRSVGWFESTEHTMSWRQPTSGETHHVLVVVQERTSGRTIPNLRVAVAVRDTVGKEVVSTTSLRMLWGRKFLYYGANIAISHGIDKVNVSVAIDPPVGMGRRDFYSGARFLTKPVHLVLNDVAVSAAVPEDEKETTQTLGGYVAPGRHPPVEPTPYPGAKGKPQ